MTIFLNTVQHFVLLSLSDYLQEYRLSDEKGLKGAKKQAVLNLMREIWSYKGAENDEATAKALKAMVEKTLQSLEIIRKEFHHPKEGGLEPRLRAMKTGIAAIIKELIAEQLANITPKLDPAVNELLTDPRLEHDPRIDGNEALKKTVDLGYRYADPRDLVRFAAACYFSLKTISDMSDDVRKYFAPPPPTPPTYWSALIDWCTSWCASWFNSSDLTEEKKKLMANLVQTCEKGVSGNAPREQQIIQIIAFIKNALSGNEKLCKGNSYSASIPTEFFSFEVMKWGVTATPSEGYFAQVSQTTIKNLEAMEARVGRAAILEKEPVICLQASQKAEEQANSIDKVPSSEPVASPPVVEQGMFKLSKAQRKKAAAAALNQPKSETTGMQCN